MTSLILRFTNDVSEIISTVGSTSVIISVIISGIISGIDGSIFRLCKFFILLFLLFSQRLELDLKWPGWWHELQVDVEFVGSLVVFEDKGLLITLFIVPFFLVETTFIWWGS